MLSICLTFSSDSAIFDVHIQIPYKYVYTPLDINYIYIYMYVYIIDDDNMVSYMTGLEIIHR